ncbi:hypothetical protein [Sphingobacterium corticibacter]|uniref:Uncharacterized protein n=1 Tax=Sphingobacterium corticibacter TaxID=2171749 RepID=A0A2T8HGE6_9SPHI|nr:hypothetical protein [Sphingobacterium corticibacter]PVH24470.1 hypothetical protein DC487_13095 [Sphingobacterium corticibacter]
MDAHVKNALHNALQYFATVEEQDFSGIETELTTTFDADLPFMDKVSKLDETFDNHPRFEELREYVFDLLMINFFAEDVQKLEEDYLDSEEWEAIEEDTLDRGSELLNVLLYLKECEDADVEPSLDDYLKEFLLVEEDEFQDEHRIYEEVIKNQILVESSFGEIAKVGAKIDIEEEIKDIFYPLMSFFAEPRPDQAAIEEFLEQSDRKSLDLAIYQLIIQFNN